MARTRVFVGGLPYGVTTEDLKYFFKGYGIISNIQIKNGYGFVEFDRQRDSENAIRELNDRKIQGKRVVVQRAHDQSSIYNNQRALDRYGPPTRTNYRLIVENLSRQVTWQDLKDFMRKAGEVTYADAHKQRPWQRPNQGIVEFATISGMMNAIKKLNHSVLGNRKINLVEEKVGKKKQIDEASCSSSHESTQSCSRSRNSPKTHRRRSRPNTSKISEDHRSRSRRSETTHGTSSSRIKSRIQLRSQDT